MPYGQILTDSITDSSGGVLAPSSSVFRNRIINGAMVIDQRNAGASVTQNTTVQYTLDRWFAYGNVTSKFTVQQNAGSVTPATGFTNYLGVTSSAATTVGSGDLYFIGQYIEGFNTADLKWGTANAQTVTLSFWVRSSLTGTFGGGLQNNAQNRSYPFSFTISSANTWEQKTVTIVGDTTGTWVGGTNGIGVRLWFSMGMGSTFSGTAGAWVGSDIRSVTGATSVVGTNGATFYITGVQLEKGSTATSFDYRDYGRELAMCQRYAYVITAGGFTQMASSLFFSATTNARAIIQFPVTMRATPTATYSAANTFLAQATANYTPSVISTTSSGGNTNFIAVDATVSGATAGQGGTLIDNNSSSAKITVTAEL